MTRARDQAGGLFSTADNSDQLTLKSTDDDANSGPSLVLSRDSGNAADNDAGGKISFQFDDDAGNATRTAAIFTTLVDASNGSEDGKIHIETMIAGAEGERFGIGPTEIVVNEAGLDLDFRIESDTQSHALFVQGSTGFVGIGCNAEADVDKELVVESLIGNECELKLRTQGGVNCSIFTAHPSTTHDFGIKCNGTEHFRVTNNGDLTATDTSISSNSDERLKKDITDYTYDLATFKKYSAKKFNWKQPQYHGDRTNQIGFIAQDLNNVDSQWVLERPLASTELEEHPEAQYLDKDLSVFTSKLGQKDAMYVSIIQQLISKIETLETKVKTLEDA